MKNTFLKGVLQLRNHRMKTLSVGRQLPYLQPILLIVIDSDQILLSQPRIYQNFSIFCTFTHLVPCANFVSAIQHSSVRCFVKSTLTTLVRVNQKAAFKGFCGAGREDCQASENMSGQVTRFFCFSHPENNMVILTSSTIDKKLEIYKNLEC